MVVVTTIGEATVVTETTGEAEGGVTTTEAAGVTTIDTTIAKEEDTTTAKASFSFEQGGQGLPNICNNESKYLLKKRTIYVCVSCS